MNNRNYLINEIQRFYDENSRVPVKRNMCVGDGYPHFSNFYKEFGSWNNAVEAAGFRGKNKINGNKICVVCGTRETTQWNNSDSGILCKSCSNKQYYEQNGRKEKDYMNGLLDIDSTVGFGFLGQRIVARKLGLELKYDCNCSVNWHHSFDLLQLDNEKYGKIEVKVAAIRIDDYSLLWQFDLGDSSECDTYVALGFTKSKSDVEKVWVIPSDRNIVIDRSMLNIVHKPKRIGTVAREIKKYEVDPKSYNDAYHSMNLDNCSVLKKYS